MMDRDAALAELADSYAIALRLRDRHASHEEIAGILGIPPESVGPHLHLAEAKLSQLMAADAHPGDA